MKREPLFINFLNKKIDTSDIIKTVMDNAEDDLSINIAKGELLKNTAQDLSQFRRDFSELVDDIIDNGISQRVVNYLDSYMKPSLLEFVDGSDGGNRVSERRTVSIKDKEAPWLEAIVCYNLCVYIKAFNISDIKCCAVCKRYFTNKGKYAKYCSETCKDRGAR